MPGMDLQGPENKGPRTGRKLGYCSGNMKKDPAVYGRGLQKRLKSGGGTGQGKRLRYNEGRSS